MAQPTGSPTRPTDLWPGSEARRARDRRVLRIAVIGAIAIHVAVLWLPIPGARALEPPASDPSPPHIIRYRPKPPAMPEPTPVVVSSRERVRPLPVPELEDDLEPISEPPIHEVEPRSEWAVDTADLLLDAGEAPPEPAIDGPLQASFPGVVNPVPWPDRARTEYPPAARRAGIEGRVTLRAIVDRHGRVQSLRVIAASNPDLGFSAAAIEAVSQWRYDPGHYRDEPVDVEMTVVVVFKIN